jgi:acyl-coenzyme A synthetase/AMP-(fatty) acid ligase
METPLTPLEFMRRARRLDADRTAVVKARQGVELITSGEPVVVDEQGREVPHDGQTLGEFARARLAHFKAPRSVRFVDELPKTATGKIQKYVLRGGRAAITAQ